MNKDAGEYIYKKNFSIDIIYIFMWIGAWGFVDNILDFIFNKQIVKYRTLVYLALFIISTYLYYSDSYQSSPAIV